jgi:hypothetical protein
MVKIICVCERHLRRKNKIMEHCTIPNNAMGSWYPFVGASFCVFSIPPKFPRHLIHLPRIHTHVHVIRTQFWSTFCLSHMCHPRSSHQIHIWKGGFCWALDLNWLWFGNLALVYKLVKTCTYKNFFFSLNHVY